MTSQPTAFALAAAILAAAGTPLLFAPAAGRKLLHWLLYSKGAAYVLFAPAAAWFAFHMWHLSDADFGQIRKPLFAITVLAGVASFFVIPEFLAVRGLAGLTLLFAQHSLDLAWMNYDPVLVWCGKTTFYAAILGALYYGTSPYKLRHHDEWMAASPARHRALGAVLVLGAVLLVAAATRPALPPPV
jgi:hypothetical protein